ncbi:MAG TPA: Hsp70 family protein [Acetobacteraceae bacterium]|nr:Hsp70 family protein [Acetobacteraceae bacterium]
MAQARFSIGIDLGTTNSALAFAPLVGEAPPEVLAVPQWDTLTSLAEAPTLPSFLYLPEEAVAGQLRGRAAGGGAWIVGRLARRRAGESPGRVVHSAKSWLAHHSADRAAPFLPWGSDDLPREQKISPVRASALILNHLRGAWDDRFAASGLAFDDQMVTVTVPASFDAAAQRLTLAAAAEAGFPDGVRLLEEPQAAFYCWLESHDVGRDLWQRLPETQGGPLHVLVVDIGGGTSDFSLFALQRDERNPVQGISRVAVSDHILLGGDNIDLALAHTIETKFGGEAGALSGTQWDHLVAACRDLKERALGSDGAPDERFAIALPARGSRLLAGSQTATLTRAELQSVLLEGFFPACPAAAHPYRAQAGLREWGLPFAADSAVTRHLADFLRDRPRVDAVLFNGGSLHPAVLRDRLQAQIAAWQDGHAPLVLANAEPDLAVARGAAHFGALLHRQSARIAAGAAQAVFLEVQTAPAADGEAAAPMLVCVLPRGAAPEQGFEIAPPGLALRTGEMVRFRAFSSARHGRARAGDLLPLREDAHHPLPPLQTLIQAAALGDTATVPVHLAASINAIGLLQLACISADPAHPRTWPLEFNLRPHEQAPAGAPAPEPVPPNATAEALDAASTRIGLVFSRPAGRERLTGAAVLKSLERLLGHKRAEWNAALLRALWPALEQRQSGRRLSADHEEAWLMLAGFLLRPGFGLPGDPARLDALWHIHERGPCFPGKRMQAQEYILWRRLVGGLSRDRQERLLRPELDRLRSGKAPPELVRLAGALELLPLDLKADLITRFTDTALTLVRAGQDATPHFAALGQLLSRAPLHAGPETVVAADLVEQTYDSLRGLDWEEPKLHELHHLFLRAARVVDDRNLDINKNLRNAIANRLEKAGVAPARTARIRGFVAMGAAERAGMYDEALPPGLVLAQ